MRISIETIRARQRMQERIQLINETPIEKLLGLFTVSEMLDINRHHTEVFASELARERGQETTKPPAAEEGTTDEEPKEEAAPRLQSLLSDPLPSEFCAAHQDQTHLLTHNKTSYDDALEDKISDDSIVTAYLPRTRTNDPEKNALAMDVVRSRRTVIAYLAQASMSLEITAEQLQIEIRPAQATPPLSAQMEAA